MMTRKLKFMYLFMLIIISCYANFFTDSFRFEPVYSLNILNSDAVQLFPIYNIYDSTLFKNDLFIKNIRNQLNVITKIKLFINDGKYLILMHFFPFPLAIKIVSIILCTFSVFLIYRIGVYLYSKDCAIVLSGLFLFYFLSMDTFYGGQDRGFGALIFCIFLLLLVKEKLLFLPFLLPLVAFFYQPFLFVLTMICLLVLFFYKKNIKFKWYILFLVINILVNIFLIFNDKLLNIMMVNVSTLVSYKYHYKNNVVNPCNPLHILLYFVFNLNEHSRLHVYFTLFFIALSLVIVVLRRMKVFRLPKAIWLILLGSVFSFFATYPINPVLASRQLVFSVPLFLVFFVSTNIFQIINRHKVNSAILLLPLISIFVVLHPMFNKIVDFKKYKPVYDYIERLPKDTLIAGNPSSWIVDKIPFFSKRAIFFADDIDSHLYISYGVEGFWERRKNLMLALYVDSLEEVKAFATMYNIDYFVIETYLYNDSFFNYLKQSVRPYDRQTWSLIKNKIDKNSFFLLEFVKKNYDFKLKDKNGYIFIISSKKVIQK